jgi:hypothetical protein
MSEKSDEKFLDMTHEKVLEIAHALCQEIDENVEDSEGYPEYVETMVKGRETLKKVPGYYPHIPREGGIPN